MPLGYIEKIMGGGKTLFTALYARRWAEKHPNDIIYANFKLNLPNAIYSPLMYMPFTKMRDCLVIIDDFHAFQNLKRFGLIIANLSRKLNIEILLTVQDWVMVPAIMRRLSNFKIIPSYSKKFDTLFIRYFIKGKRIPKLIFRKPVKRVVIPEKLYNTNEVVVFPTENQIKNEILKFSENINDLEVNIFLYSGNRGERARLLKELIKRKGWKKPNKDESEGDNKWLYEELAILNSVEHISYNELSLYTGIPESTIYKNVQKVKLRIKRKFESI